MAVAKAVPDTSYFHMDGTVMVMSGFLAGRRAVNRPTCGNACSRVTLASVLLPEPAVPADWRLTVAMIWIEALTFVVISSHILLLLKHRYRSL